ncbi:MAG: hypothetical protein Q9187_009135, partial [Circinaria calcarea]
MDPLSITASIIGVVGLSGQVVKYLNDFKALPAEVTVLGGELNTLQEMLLRLRDRVEQTTTGESEMLARHLRFSGVLTDIMNQLQALLSKMKKTDIENQSGRLRKLRFGLVLREWDVRDTLEALKRFKLILLLAISASNISIVQQIHSNAGSLEGFQAEEKIAEICTWLAPFDFQGVHHDNLARYQEGTGLWLLGDPKFEAWINGHGVTLWCSGT